MIQHIKRHFILLVNIVLVLTASAMTVDEVPNVHLASRARYVSNPSGVLSESAVSSLDAAIARLWDKTSVEMVVVAIDRIDPSMTPEEFATALFEKWGIGKSDKDNGLLLLISRDDRAVQIRTGYGLEGVVPDIIAGRVIRDEIVPRFRNGDYDGGTLAAVNRLSAVILDPSVREELMSAQKNDTPKSISDGFDGEEVFSFFLKGALAIALIMLAIIIYYIRSSRRMDDVERWRYLNTLWVPAAIVAFATLGIGAIPFAILS
ncbi:YgcG family protein, partial [uncultured Duncaniella sp.]